MCQSVLRYFGWRGEAIDEIMDHGITPLERAFQLAKSGSFASVTDIKKQLHEEGYSIVQVTGRVLRKQLEALIQAARG